MAERATTTKDYASVRGVMHKNAMATEKRSFAIFVESDAQPFQCSYRSEHTEAR